MSPYLWFAITVMAVLATFFLLRPLLGAGRRKTVIVLALVLPLFAAGLYLIYGSPNVKSGRSTAPFMNSAASNSKIGSVASMIDGLKIRLTKNPEDGKGWLLLARSYEHLNRVNDAINAYAKAEKLGQSDPELSTRLSALSDTGINQSTPQQIVGRLSLSKRAADIVAPTDTVFIFARAAGGAGVPAAVLQRSASDLPMEFRLDDSLSMIDSVKLSDFEEVVVTARISRSGNATEALQQLEAKTQPIRVATTGNIELLIE